MHPAHVVRMHVMPSIVVALAACTTHGGGSSAPEPAPTASVALPAAVTPAGSFARAPAPSDAPEQARGGGPSTATAPPRSSACPADMVLVEGGYCPDPIFQCLAWMDPPGAYHEYRCAKYGKPVCASPKRAEMRFCIDRYEYTKAGEKLPEVNQSWTSASAVCASQGKRLCGEAEWQFACEGPEMHPYPYGDGLTRDATACNIDRMDLGRPNALTDHRMPAGSNPRCVSPFGVYDMSGNVEEWATQEHPPDPTDRSTMKGAWWLPGRNTCRARTVGHTEIYAGSQVGVRCCAAAK